MTLWTNAHAIQHWLETKDASGELPRVIRSLIQTTWPAAKVSMPAGKLVNSPGFDGEVCTPDEGAPSFRLLIDSADSASSYVPVGESVWEISVRKEFVKKLNEDYAKLCRQFKGKSKSDRGSITLVFVTGRLWTKEAKTKWISKHRSGGWKDLRILDATDLEEWIEQSPAGTRLWIARHVLERLPYDVDLVPLKWKALCQSTGLDSIPLSRIMLAGCPKIAQRLSDWHSGNPEILKVAASHPEEVPYLFMAWVATQERDHTAAPTLDSGYERNDSLRRQIEGRSVIVRSRGAWDELRYEHQPAVLVVHEQVMVREDELVAAARAGHHVLRCLPNLAANTQQVFSSNDEDFSSMSVWANVASELQKAGKPRIRSQQLVKQAAGSAVVLVSCLSGEAWTETPNWVAEASPRTIAACLLLGGGSSMGHDPEAFSAIAGQPFEDCEWQLQRMSSSSFPMITLSTGSWKLISITEAWRQHSSHVTPSDLKRFMSLAKEILSDDDPGLVMPHRRLVKRRNDRVRGSYSSVLKAGIAATLAQLSQVSDVLLATWGFNVKTGIHEVLEAVMGQCPTTLRWASLDEVVELLSESDVKWFLRQVNSDLQSGDSAIAPLMRRNTENAITQTNGDGLIRALVKLCWDGEVLVDAAEALLRLARCAMNQNATSQSHIGRGILEQLKKPLCSWYPQTTADFSKRVSVLDSLLSVDAELAFELLGVLLPPHSDDSTHDAPGPIALPTANDWMPDPFCQDHPKFKHEVAERLISYAGRVTNGWKCVFERVGALPEEDYPYLLAATQQLPEMVGDDHQRCTLSELLRDRLNYAFKHAPDDRRLPPDVFLELTTLLQRLRPSDVVLRDCWLFRSFASFLFIGGPPPGVAAQTLKLAQIEAMRELVDVEGSKAIEQLRSINVDSIDVQWNHVGEALAEVSGDQFRKLVFSRYLRPEQRDWSLAAAFIDSRFKSSGWQWVDDALNVCTSIKKKGLLLAAVDLGADAWKRIPHSKSAQSAYWKQRWIGGHVFDPSERAFVVEMFLQHDRPEAALELVYRAINRGEQVDREIIARSLEAWSQVGSEEQRRRSASVGVDYASNLAKLAPSGVSLADAVAMSGPG